MPRGTILQAPPGADFAALAAELASGRAAEGSLADAALLLAAELEPGLDAPAARAELARLGAEAARRAEAALPPERLARVLHLLREEGFQGNSGDYDDPRNSFLDQVLRRRTGIPITLAVVLIEVGRRAGLALEGISFPRHFLVRAGPGPADAIVDPFELRVLDDAECQRRLELALGPEAVFERAELHPATLREILVRMLGNLKRAFVGRGDLVRAATCCDRILLLAPDHASELRDRGLLYEQLDCPGAACDDLERFLALAPEDPSAPAVRRRLGALRRAAADASLH